MFEVLNGKETDDKDGDEYDFGCGDEDDDAVSVVSSCMGDRSFDRTSTAILTTMGQREMMMWTMNNATRLNKTKLQPSH